MAETPKPTTRNMLTVASQVIYAVPAGVPYAIVRNIHACNTGGAIEGSLYLKIGGMKFYDMFPVPKTLDRDTYLVLGPGDTIEASAGGENSVVLFVTMVEGVAPGG